jgi:hypothetical protein
MLALRPLLSAPTLILLAFLPIPTHAASADCVLSANNFALARVVSKQAIHYISGPRKGAPECPSAANACRLQTYLVPGDEVLTSATADPYVCTRFKSQKFIESIGWLPRAALELIAVGANPPVQNWEGRWRRDREAEIVIKSQGEDVAIAGNATWGGSDPERVKRGAINTGELEGSFRPRGQLLAIGYDPGRSEFPPAEDAAPDICAAKLELYGRYLIVEDNGKCGGLNVSFNGLYVRANAK